MAQISSRSFYITSKNLKSSKVLNCERLRTRSSRIIKWHCNVLFETSPCHNLNQKDNMEIFRVSSWRSLWWSVQSYGKSTSIFITDPYNYASCIQMKNMNISYRTMNLFEFNTHSSLKVNFRPSSHLFEKVKLISCSKSFLSMAAAFQYLAELAWTPEMNVKCASIFPQLLLIYAFRNIAQYLSNPFHKINVNGNGRTKPSKTVEINCCNYRFFDWFKSTSKHKIRAVVSVSSAVMF